MSDLHAKQRQQRIVALLRQRGFLKTTDLVVELKVSSATVRRDLEALRTRGKIERVHGGASLPHFDTRFDIRYQERQEEAQAAKQKMAYAALSLVQQGQTVYLDAGTSARAFAQALRRKPELTQTLRIVTHGLDVAYELNGACSLVVIGGEVYGSTYSLTGPDALETIQKYTYDTFFVGCTSLSAKQGLTNSNVVEAVQKTAIMQRSTSTILLAHGDKWGAGDFASFAKLSDLTSWVTDQASSEATEAMRAAGVKIWHPE